jgi:hypothetical protein
MSSYTNPTNQTLPTAGQPRATEETDVRNWLTYWQSQLQTFFTANNKLSGGTGFDSDNIANKAIKSIHLQPQKKFFRSTLTNSNFGTDGLVYLIIAITTTFDNAYIDLSTSVGWEPGTVNANTMCILQIQKSTSGGAAFTTVAPVAVSYSSRFYLPTNGNFSWHNQIASGFDVVTFPGTTYYRAKIALERIGLLATSATTGVTFVSNGNLQNWIKYEVTQQPTA